jgi:hypothetical protein
MSALLKLGATEDWMAASLLEACFPGPIRFGRSEGLFSLVAMYASRFRDCVCKERNRAGGARKKRGSQRPRATLQWEVHAAQEVLEACGARSVSWPLKRR